MAKVFIPNETKVRELDGKILLSSHLLENKYTIFLGSRSGIKREILASYSSIYIIKSITEEEKDFYRDLKIRDHKIIVLHSEGCMLLDDIETELLSMYPESCDKYIDFYFVSGIKIKEMMGIYTPYIDQSKIKIVGDPKFDLLKNRYRKHWEHEINELKNKYKKFILVNTNFGEGNSIVGDEALINWISENPDYTENFKKTRLYKMQFIKDVMLCFISAIKKISSEFSDYNIIIRPHPSESSEKYIEEFKDLENVEVIHEGSVIKWILASEAVLHYDCTTGVESLLANKPTISFAPKLDKSINAWLPIRISQTAETESELIKLFKINLNNSEVDIISSEKLDLLNEYLLNAKKTSSEIVQYYINKINLINKNQSVSFRDEIYLLYKRLRESLSIKKSILLGNPNISIKKFPFIKKSEVERKLTTLNEIEKFSNDIRVNQLGVNVVKINKN